MIVLYIRVMKFWAFPGQNYHGMHKILAESLIP